MTYCKMDPLRVLTDEEREVLTQISRSASAPASHVARAKALLAVADGQNYQEAARAAGRRAGDAVAQLVSRFNREGLAALAPGMAAVRSRSTAAPSVSGFLSMDSPPTTPSHTSF